MPREKRSIATKAAFVLCLLVTGWFAIGVPLGEWWANASGHGEEAKFSMDWIGAAFVSMIVAWPVTIVLASAGCKRCSSLFAQIVRGWSVVLIPLALALTMVLNSVLERAGVAAR